MGTEISLIPKQTLAQLVSRNHSDLQNITTDQHHAEVHALSAHGGKATLSQLPNGTTDLAIVGTGAGTDPVYGNPGPSAQNVVTGSRAINTVYQNTGNKPLFVTITFTVGGTTVSADIKCDSNAAPATVIASVSPKNATAITTITFIVLPSYYYKLYQGGSVTLTMQYWTEWS